MDDPVLADGESWEVAFLVAHASGDRKKEYLVHCFVFVSNQLNPKFRLEFASTDFKASFRV